VTLFQLAKPRSSFKVSQQLVLMPEINADLLQNLNSAFIAFHRIRLAD